MEFLLDFEEFDPLLVQQWSTQCANPRCKQSTGRTHWKVQVHFALLALLALFDSVRLGLAVAKGAMEEGACDVGDTLEGSVMWVLH